MAAMASCPTCTAPRGTRIFCTHCGNRYEPKKVIFLQRRTAVSKSAAKRLSTGVFSPDADPLAAASAAAATPPALEPPAAEPDATPDDSDLYDDPIYARDFAPYKGLYARTRAAETAANLAPDFEPADAALPAAKRRTLFRGGLLPIVRGIEKVTFGLYWEIQTDSAASAPTPATPPADAKNGESAAAAPEKAPPTPEECVEIRLFAVKPNGEMAWSFDCRHGGNQKILLDRFSEKDPDTQYGEKGRVSIETKHFYEDNKEVAVFYVCVGARRGSPYTPVLSKLTCRIEAKPKKGEPMQIGWIHLTPTELKQSTAVLVAGIHRAPPLAIPLQDKNETPWWEVESIRIGLPLSHVGHLAPVIMDCAQTRFRTETYRDQSKVGLDNSPFAEAPMHVIMTDTCSVGVGWDYRAENPDADLDLVCFLGEHWHIIGGFGSVKEVIYAHNKTSERNAATHSGDVVYGSSPYKYGAGQGDDERITLNLKELMYNRGQAHFCVCPARPLIAPAGVTVGHLRVTTGAPESRDVLTVPLKDTDLRTNSLVFVSLIMRGYDNMRWWNLYLHGFSVPGTNFVPCMEAVKHFSDNAPAPRLSWVTPVPYVPLTKPLPSGVTRPADPTPSSTAGSKLYVMLWCGFDLPAMDTGTFDNYTSDPYVYIKGGGMEVKSRVVPKDLMPFWNEEFLLEGSFTEAINFGVYDKDLVGAEWMGSGKISLVDTHIPGPHIIHLEGQAGNGGRTTIERIGSGTHATHQGHVVASFSWGTPAGLRAKY